MKFCKYLPALLAAAALSLTACGIDDEPDNDNDNNNGDALYDASDPAKNLTPEEIKERVADIAIDLMDKFRVEDHQELANLTAYLIEEYGDIRYRDEEPTYSPRLSRSYEIIDLVEDIPTGIYTPVDGYWTLTASSNNTVLRIPQDSKYGRVELTLSRSGRTDADVNIPEEGDFYVVLPTTVEATLTANGKTYISQKLAINLNLDSKTLSATETLSAANLSAYTTVDATNSQANISATANINGELITATNATVVGRNLCDIESIIEAAEDESFDRMFTSISGSGNILNSLYCNFNVKALGEVLNAWDSWFDFGSSDWYEYSSEQAASTACDNAIALINRNLTTTFSLADGGQNVASLIFIKNGERYTWSDGYYGEFYPAAALLFNDGTTYTDEYFDYGFDAVIKKWETLIRAYEHLCD